MAPQAASAGDGFRGHLLVGRAAGSLLAKQKNTKSQRDGEGKEEEFRFRTQHRPIQAHLAPLHPFLGPQSCDLDRMVTVGGHLFYL